MWHSASAPKSRWNFERRPTMVYRIIRMFLRTKVLAIGLYVFGAVFIFRRLLLAPHSFRLYVSVLRADSLYFCLLWLNYIECIRTHDSISASDSKFTIAIVLSTRIYYRGIQILANLQHFGWYLALAACACTETAIYQLPVKITSHRWIQCGYFDYQRMFAVFFVVPPENTPHFYFRFILTYWSSKYVTRWTAYGEYSHQVSSSYDSPSALACYDGYC